FFKGQNLYKISENERLKIRRYDLGIIFQTHYLFKGFSALENINVRLRAIGKTGIEYFNFQKIELLEKYLGLSSSPDYDKACS
ncbi:hypothetical protein VWN94_10865, partial [Campylobacter coli]|nr:hypothetical protein [Campylobacter coli]